MNDKERVIIFLFTLFIFFVLSGHKANAAFDCLKLTTSSAQVDKDYCQTELNQIEAELRNLLVKQKSRNVILYKANLENQIFKETKKFYNIKSILDFGLIDSQGYLDIFEIKLSYKLLSII